MSPWCPTIQMLKWSDTHGTPRGTDGCELILDAASKLFSEEEIDTVSIRAVNREAGLGWDQRRCTTTSGSRRLPWKRCSVPVAFCYHFHQGPRPSHQLEASNG